MSKQRRSRGAGFVRERGESGRQLVVKIEGHQYVRSVRARTLKEAQKMLPGFIVEIQGGAVAAAKAAKVKASESPTYSVAVAEFIEREMSPDERNATRQAYAASLNRIGKVLGNSKVSEIDRHMIKDCLLTVNRGSTIGTTKLVHVVLGLFFRSLVDREIIPTNPVQPFKALKLPPAGKKTKRREALTGGQVAALLQACGGDDDLRLWISVMAASGMRPGEALALTWGSIDFGAGLVRVEHSVKESGIRGQGRLGSTKTPSSVRDIPLGPVIASSLEHAYLGRQAFYRGLGLKIEVDDCVFAADLIDARKVPKSLSAMQSRFRNIRDKAGLPNASGHYLRHSAITAAIAGTATTPGVSMADAAKIAGHSNATQIARVYGHPVQANLTRGIALADAMLGPQPAPRDNVTRLPARK